MGYAFDMPLPAADAKARPPWIVVLNGASCSGKSTLAREIVEQSPAPTIHLSLDQSHASLGSRHATDRWPLYSSLCLGLARTAAAWWQQGFNVVVDTVLRSRPHVRRTLALLPRERSFLVGVHAPLEILLVRAAARPGGDRRKVRRQFEQLQGLDGNDLNLTSDHEAPAALAARVLGLVGEKARHRPPPEALADLRTIEAGDQATFMRAVHAAGCRGWHCYFPFLHAFARTVRHELRWEEHAGSLLVYHLIETAEGRRLSLYLPPLPFTAAAFAQAQERSRRFDPKRRLRIRWVEESQLAALSAATAQARVVDSEHVCDATDFAVSPIEASPDFVVRPYQSADRAACEALLETGRSGGQRPYKLRGDYRLATLCLENSAEFERGLLRADVVTVAGAVRAFTFGGPIRPGLGSILVAITDPSLPELRRWQRGMFMRNHRDLTMWTEGGDHDRPRIDAALQQLEPRSRSQLWRVVLRR